eukprot:6197278-Heterocapsa_arctica.AAC.1
MDATAERAPIAAGACATAPRADPSMSRSAAAWAEVQRTGLPTYLRDPCGTDADAASSPSGGGLPSAGAVAVEEDDE